LERKNFIGGRDLRGDFKGGSQETAKLESSSSSFLLPPLLSIFFEFDLIVIMNIEG